jgi:hypothetical protein
MDLQTREYFILGPLSIHCNHLLYLTWKLQDCKEKSKFRSVSLTAGHVYSMFIVLCVRIAHEKTGQYNNTKVPAKLLTSMHDQHPIKSCMYNFFPDD